MGAEAIPMERWEWWGRAGHFIGARSCLFHLHTHVGPYCVSTVGAYHPYRDRGEGVGEIETIGCDRTHETMVFRHLPDGTNDYSELDFEGYNDDEDAAAGHIRMCHRWAERAAADEHLAAAMTRDGRA